MGAMKQSKLEKKDAKHGRFQPRTYQSSGTADWGNVDPRTLVKAIETVARAGGALRFGYTRDGGAYALGIYGDGDPHTVYIKPSEDISAVLDELVEYFDGLRRDTAGR